MRNFEFQKNLMATITFGAYKNKKISDSHFS